MDNFIDAPNNHKIKHTEKYHEIDMDCEYAVTVQN